MGSGLRFLWNWMLAQRRDTYKASEGRVHIGYAAQAAQLPAMKAIFPWLGDVPSQPLQQTLMDLDTAFQRFFEKKAGYPAFKSKMRGNPGIRWPQAWKSTVVPLASQARLGEGAFSRRVVGIIKSATVRHDGLRWHVSILCEVEHVIPTTHTGEPVGVMWRGGERGAFRWQPHQASGGHRSRDEAGGQTRPPSLPLRPRIEAARQGQA
jgi:putative transposase